ncbi:MAG: DNA internalization-related competence protein ComEC/Rec2 [Betaproteobacteria bacterium RIFCSPLOWO2_02_FULL_67_26]|nr:MAG: DNA internalization-related competence protein ComEC/Rec2 [Betaproteobacteria bacterium RIFCSPLOWO2_02_FULL_67_26]
MRLDILCFVAGAWWLQQQAALPEPGWAWVLAAAGLAATIARPETPALRITREIAVSAACFALGFGWAAWCAQQRLADALPVEWEGRDIPVVGVVAGLPQAHERGVRFEFDVERVLAPGARVPRHIVLSWWGSPARDGGHATFPPLEPGERWQLTVRLKRPHGTANPHGFDYEAWLFERNLRASGYVRPKAGSHRAAERVHEPRYWIERVRSLVRARIRAALPGEPYAGIIAALAIGDQRAIPPEQWQTFTRTGVNHLMSISGLHVTMVSGLVFALVYGLWRRVPRLTLALPAAKAAVLAAFCAALLYSLLAGYAVPAQRTVYMLAVVAAALWLGIFESASLVLLAALLVVVLFDPWAVLAPGYWLSFGAVAVILYVTVGRIGREHWLASWTRVQIAVTLALIPPLLAMFQQVSIVSPLANAAAIPAVSLVVVPLTLIGIALPFDFILSLAHLVMGWCMVMLEWFAAMPDAVWQQHAPPAWTVVVAAAGLALLLAPRGLPARWLGAIGLLPLFVVAPNAPRAGDVEVVVLDVGQGLSTVVRTAHHALLYDTGPRFGPAADSGSRIVVPYLRAAGVNRLDGMIVSHDDDDHWGGAASVLQALPAGWVLTSLPDLDPLVVQAGPALRCAAGSRWEWDGVRFEVLHPTRASYDDASVRDNDRSCVLKIESPGGSALLPADIERRAEQEILARARERLHADVLVAPHQGSRTSSIPDFVGAVSPRVVVFPVGYRNRFGHPHREVVQRYRDAGVRIYRTDRDGAVTIAIRAEGAISVTPYRASYRRYWQTPLAGDPVPDPEELRGMRDEG